MDDDGHAFLNTSSTDRRKLQSIQILCLIVGDEAFARSNLNKKHAAAFVAASLRGWLQRVSRHV